MKAWNLPSQETNLLHYPAADSKGSSDLSLAGKEEYIVPLQQVSENNQVKMDNRQFAATNRLFQIQE